MSLFGFGKRSRRRSRKSKRRSRRSRRSRKSSFERVGNKIHISGRKGKTKVLKIKKNKDGREYYVSGKRKTKHFLDSRKTRKSRKSRRRFGYMKNTLLNYMGNFQPPAMMSLAQSTTGYSAPQMIGHMDDVALSNRSNFYTNIK